MKIFVIIGLSHTYVHQYAENDTHLMFVTSDNRRLPFCLFL